jgi:hypothetical protein
MTHVKVEVPITNHLKYFVSNLEKYKAVQIIRVLNDRNKVDYKFIGKFYSLNW